MQLTKEGRWCILSELLSCSIILIRLTIVSSAIVTSRCPSPTSRENPRFLRTMKKSSAVKFNQPEEIECCVDGFISLKWTFRSNVTQEWSNYIPEGYKLSRSNTSLTIMKFRRKNNGYYKCTATDGFGRSKSGITNVEVACSPPSSRLNIQFVTQQTSFYEYYRSRLCCNMTTIAVLSVIHVLWKNNRGDDVYEWAIYPNGKNLRHRRDLPSKKGFVWSKGFVTGKENRCHSVTNIQTCMELEKMAINDTGTYTCGFWKDGEFKDYNISLSVIKKRFYVGLHLGITSAFGVLLLFLTMLLWTFYYDLLLIIRRFCRPLQYKDSKYDLSIIYDERDNEHICVAMTIANVLSKYGVKSFIFDRDKSYGSTIHDDYLIAISQSSRILFLLTLSTTDNENVLFCFKNAKQRKFYILYPKITKTLRHFSITKTEKDMNDEVRTSKRVYTWRKCYREKSFLQRRFFMWILTQLPNGGFFPAKVQSASRSTEFSKQLIQK